MGRLLRIDIMHSYLRTTRSNLMLVFCVLGLLMLGCSSNVDDPNSITAKADRERDEHLKQAKIALEDGFDEKDKKFGRIEDAEKHLSEIRRFDKQYKESVTLQEEIQRRKNVIESLKSPREKIFERTKIEVKCLADNNERIYERNSAFDSHYKYRKKRNDLVGSCYYNRVSIDNGSPYKIKDLKVECQLIAESGTILEIKNLTIYKQFDSKIGGGVSDFDFESTNRQVKEIQCNLNDFTITQ